MLAAGIKTLDDEKQLAKTEARGIRVGGVLQGRSVLKRWDNLWMGGEKMTRLLWTTMDIVEVDENTRYLVGKMTDNCPLCGAQEGHAEAVLTAREDFRRKL